MRKKLYSSWNLPVLLVVMLFAFSGYTWSQTDLTGKVLDGNTGEPLPGVNVTVKGTTTGTITDLDGNFQIKVEDPNAILSFSYVGYLTENVELNGQTSIDLNLLPDLMKLEQVVVVGYGTMRKKDLTGSVSSVSIEDIEANKDANVLHALQGKVAGMDILPSDGQAGAGVEISLRGTRSMLAGNEPLILVDGVEYGKVLDLNSSDIESIDILKDAASTAIYGTKGANGVIIITTKKGEAGKTKVSYNTYFSYNMPNFFPHYMNGDEFLNKQYEKRIADEEADLWEDQDVYYDPRINEVVWDQDAVPDPTAVFGTVTLEQLIEDEGVEDKYELVNSDPNFLELARAGVSQNYMDMLLSNSWSQNHELSVTGGTDKTAYNLSIGYMKAKGLMINDENGNPLDEQDMMRRYNFKIGVDQQIAKFVRVGANILYTRKFQNRRSSSVFGYARNAGPIGELYYPDGSYLEVPDPVFSANQYNPLLDNKSGTYKDEEYTNRIFGNAYIDVNILKDLSFKTQFGFDNNQTKHGIYADAYSTRQIAVTNALTTLDNYQKTSYTWTNVLNYKKQLGNHDIQLMAGSETRSVQYDRSRFLGSGQSLASTEYFDWVGFAGSITADQGYLTDATDPDHWQYAQTRLVSFFGRANYGLMDKYLLQATLRYDASSVLAEGNKGAIFPSFSAGWRLGQEDFIENLNVFSNLKLRYSWGISGNSAIPPYSSTASLGDLPNYYTFGDEFYSQYVPYQTANTSLTWELTKAHNIGVDVGFFKNRISGSVDYYISKTSDLLFRVPLPASEGYPSAIQNVAATKNSGIEVSFTTVNIDTRAFTWTTDWIFSRVKNEITGLREGVTELIRTDEVTGNTGSQEEGWKVGEPVESWYTYNHLGFYSVADLDAELAYVRQQEANGDTINVANIPMLANGWLPGDIKLEDINKDGIFNDDDRIYLNEEPKFTFSFNNDFLLKTDVGDFGLGVLMIGRAGYTIRYRFYGDVKLSSDNTNGAYVPAWTPQNPGDAIYPRYYSNGTANTSSLVAPIKFIDGSFVKIKDITLSYTLPNNWTQSMKISRLKIYFTARNMITFSKIKDSDPELGGEVNFPLAKQFFVGLNLDF